MIEEEFEEPIISRSMRRSGLSFGVSVIVHLSLFLVFALVFFTAAEDRALTLDVGAVSDYSDIYIDEMPALQVAADESENELEEPQFEDLLEEPIDLNAGQLPDIATLVGDSLDVFEVDEPVNNISVVRAAPTKGFFGIEATGDRIIYLIDNSPSMGQGEYQRRYDRAVDEVLNSVDQLRPEQEFYVFLFSHQFIPMNINGKTDYCFPTDANKAGLESWLRSVGLGSGTDPREALVAALGMQPSCCFLLSDGEFNGRKWGNGKYGRRISAVTLAKTNNQIRSPIHTIGLEDKGNQKDMTKIASQSGGIYKFIPKAAQSR